MCSLIIIVYSSKVHYDILQLFHDVSFTGRYAKVIVELFFGERKRMFQFKDRVVFISLDCSTGITFIWKQMRKS